MREMAERAIQLDPLLEEAHDALGLVYARDGRWGQAEASFRRAIELNPNSELTRVNYAISLLSPLGRIDEAVQQLREAEKSDPLSPTLHYVYGEVLLSAGRYKEASVHCGKSSDVAECQGRVFLGEGKIDDAIKTLASAPNTRYLGYAYGRAGRRQEVEQLAAVSPPRWVRAPPWREALYGNAATTALEEVVGTTSSRRRQKYTAIRTASAARVAPNSPATYLVLLLSTVSGSKNC
jgi:tetratricopeptide (TPR) repeat protein